MPARSAGSISSCMLRSSAAPCATAARVAAGAGVADLTLDLGPLGVDDLAELLCDLVVHAAEVESLQALLALAPQAVEQVADPLDHLALPVAEPRLQQPPEGGVEVAVVEQVVGHLLEDGVGIQAEADLRAVPAAVPEPGARPRPPPYRSQAPDAQAGRSHGAT